MERPRFLGAYLAIPRDQCIPQRGAVKIRGSEEIQIDTPAMAEVKGQSGAAGEIEAFALNDRSKQFYCPVNGRRGGFWKHLTSS